MVQVKIKGDRDQQQKQIKLMAIAMKWLCKILYISSRSAGNERAIERCRMIVIDLQYNLYADGISRFIVWCSSMSCNPNGFGRNICHLPCIECKITFFIVDSIQRKTLSHAHTFRIQGNSIRPGCLVSPLWWQYKAMMDGNFIIQMESISMAWLIAFVLSYIIRLCAVSIIVR